MVTATCLLLHGPHFGGASAEREPQDGGQPAHTHIYRLLQKCVRADALGMRARVRRGTSLVEIMVALVFIAIVSGALLDAVARAGRNSEYAVRRSQALSLLQQRIEQVRADASGGSISTATINWTATPHGMTEPVNYSIGITARAGSTSDLFDVVGTATWQEVRRAGTRSDQATIWTIVRKQ